jgi:hypothetical protein
VASEGEFMPIKSSKNGRRRFVRVGRLVSPPTRLSPQALRRQQLSDAKKAAQKKKPKLDKLIGKLAKLLRASAEEVGRYGHVPVLAKIYRKAWEWNEEGVLERRAVYIVALQGKKWRKNSTSLGVFVGAVCEQARTNLKTASRWAGILNKALNDKIQPGDIEARLMRTH